MTTAMGCPQPLGTQQSGELQLARHGDPDPRTAQIDNFRQPMMMIMPAGSFVAEVPRNSSRRCCVLAGIQARKSQFGMNTQNTNSHGLYPMIEHLVFEAFQSRMPPVLK
ncbi:hypothetical protein [Ensifer adhaerens]|uniref:hypothetical protein n=1 Tax=Ensifer adhaerens TaxID=106592 RepID=UPI00128F8565|nr:hypothetical protein [Ensifer adhaerens]